MTERDINAFYRKRAKLNRLEKKELPELTRIRGEMRRLAEKGSVTEQKNLPLIEAGIEKANREIVELKSWLAKWDGSFGNVWITKEREQEAL